MAIKEKNIFIKSIKGLMSFSEWDFTVKLNSPVRLSVRK